MVRRPSKTETLVAISALFFAGGILAGAGGASGAAPDRTSPDLTVTAEWIVGSQIGTSDLLNETVDDDYTTAQYSIDWSASDASGMSHFTTFLEYAGDTPSFLNYYDAGETLEFQGELEDYFGDFGGGSLEPVGWTVDAFDLADNGREVSAGGRPHVIQENGDSPNSSGWATIDLNGTWQTSTCACASGGRQAFTTQLGAAAVITTNAGFGATRIGLVMAKGPGRGQADIFVDGSKVTTINTNAAANKNRIIVWTRTLNGGSHVIRVRNVATSGHPRIDFDAVLLR